MARKKSTTTTAEFKEAEEQKTTLAAVRLKRKMTDTVTVYECSECHATMWAELPQCPKCGVSFVKTQI